MDFIWPADMFCLAYAVQKIQRRHLKIGSFNRIPDSWLCLSAHQSHPHAGYPQCPLSATMHVKAQFLGCFPLSWIAQALQVLDLWLPYHTIGYHRLLLDEWACRHQGKEVHGKKGPFSFKIAQILSVICDLFLGGQNLRYLSYSLSLEADFLKGWIYRK